MGTIVALDEYKRTIDRREAHTRREPPVIRGGEIWGRDYTDIEAVVFGLLKVREIATYHHGDFDTGLDRLCLNALEAAYTVADNGTALLKESIRPLKEWLVDSVTEENKRDISWAIVLCDLIEKSPTR